MRNTRKIRKTSLQDLPPEELWWIFLALPEASMQEFDKSSWDLSQVSKTSPGRTALSWKDMLETLVRKVQGSRVMAVLGPQAGRVGRLLHWDGEQSQAVFTCGERTSWWSLTVMLSASTWVPGTQTKTDPWIHSFPQAVTSSEL
uniref:Uncharacterized protein n=1 Tax=Pipistrellus kuhlii TaxID=59472 RepID=A0A7J7SGL3_PIPKU|nr:hypothetical protein mPipKuh1_009961 [Pipistrellus kuhlii]